MRKLSVLVVGCGGISGHWLGTLRSFEDVTVAGLVDLDQDRAAQAAVDYGVADAYVSADLDEALRHVKPDVVCDCTVPSAHHDVVTAALTHGAHVLGEKPMAETMEQARAMGEAARRAGRLYAVMQNRRYLPDIVRCRDFLRSGAIGEVTTVNADFYIGAHFGGFRDEMEHVLILDMAIHTFDQARFIAGCDPVAVYAHEWNPKGSWYRHGASAIVAFEMTGGVVFTYRGSWCCEGLNTSWESSWRIAGSRGCLVWDGGSGMRAEAPDADSGFVRKQRELVIPPPSPMPHTAHAGCIRDFLDCVKEGRVPQTTHEDNIKSLAMVHAAIESASSGRRVVIT